MRKNILMPPLYFFLGMLSGVAMGVAVMVAALETGLNV
jgi:hypothetical protein